MTIFKVDGLRLVRNIPALKIVAKQQPQYFLSFYSAIVKLLYKDDSEDMSKYINFNDAKFILFFYLFENKYLLKTHDDEWVHVICICFPSSLHSNVTIHWFKHGICLIYFYIQLVEYIFGNRADVQPTHIDISFCSIYVRVQYLFPKSIRKVRLKFLKISSSKIGRDESPLSH